MGNSIASMSMNRYDGNLKMDHPEKRIPVADANAIITVIRYAARGLRVPRVLLAQPALPVRPEAC